MAQGRDRTPLSTSDSAKRQNPSSLSQLESSFQLMKTATKITRLHTETEVRWVLNWGLL